MQHPDFTFKEVHALAVQNWELYLFLIAPPHVHVHVIKSAALSMIKSHGYAKIKLCLISSTPQYFCTGGGMGPICYLFSQIAEPTVPVANLPCVFDLFYFYIIIFVYLLLLIIIIYYYIYIIIIEVVSLGIYYSLIGIYSLKSYMIHILILVAPNLQIASL